MKKPVTDVVRAAYDRSPIVVRRIIDIAERYWPKIEKGLQDNMNLSVSLREAISAQLPTPVDSYNLAQIPFSVLISVLDANSQKAILQEISNMHMGAYAGADTTGRSRNAMLREVDFNLDYIRAVFLKSSEVYRPIGSSFIPAIEALPSVTMATTETSPTREIVHQDISSFGGVSSGNIFVKRIGFSLLYDVDSTIKCYFSFLKQQNIFDDVERQKHPAVENFIQRVCASGLITLCAAIAKGIGIYHDGFNEVSKLSSQIMDEAFLEYQDISSDADSVGRDIEPQWLRINVTRISALLEAVVKSQAIDRNTIDNRVFVFYSTMFNALSAYFTEKGATSNVIANLNHDGIVSPTMRLAEKAMLYVDDAVIKSYIDEVRQSDGREPLRTGEEHTSYFSSRDKRTGILKQLIVILGYTILMIYAASGLDRKYNQFNNYFGRKGGYKEMVFKALSGLKKHITGITDLLHGYREGPYTFCRANDYIQQTTQEFSLTWISSAIRELLDGKSSYSTMFTEMVKLNALAALDIFSISPRTYDAFRTSIDDLDKVMGELGQCIVDHDFETIQRDIPLTNFFAPYQADRQFVMRSLEEFTQDVAMVSDAVDSTSSVPDSFMKDVEDPNDTITAEDELGYGNYNVITKLAHEACRLEEEANLSAERFFEDHNDRGEESFGYAALVRESVAELDRCIAKKLMGIDSPEAKKTLFGLESDQSVSVKKEAIPVLDFKQSEEVKVIKFIEDFVQDFQKYLSDNKLRAAYSLLEDEAVFKEFHGVIRYDVKSIVHQIIKDNLERKKDNFFIQVKLAISNKSQAGENAQTLWNQALGYAMGHFKKTNVDYMEIYYYYYPPRNPDEQVIMLQYSRPISAN